MQGHTGLQIRNVLFKNFCNNFNDNKLGVSKIYSWRRYPYLLVIFEKGGSFTNLAGYKKFKSW